MKQLYPLRISITLRRLLFLTLFIISGQQALVAQYCPLVCNDKVNVSMPAEVCNRTLEPRDFLNNSNNCDPSLYEVILTHPFGTTNAYPNYVDRSHLGYTFVYSVKDPASGNSCWGYVTIEDKSGPPVPCKNATISCFQVNEINKVTNETEDACSGSASKVTLTTTWADYGCDSATVLGRVYRHIVATDAWGNASHCDDTLTIRKDVLDSVCCPSMVTLPCRLYALNGAKLLGSLKSTTSIPFLQVFNSKNYDLYQFSNNKNSPFYPTPELLLNIQGHGDPLVEFGVTDGRISGTKLLLDNVVVPNAFFQGGINPNSFAIHKDSLVVPAIKDSALDLNKTNTFIKINDDLDEINIFTEPNPNYCKPSSEKTLMYKYLGGLCKLVVNYNDEILPICGNGFKIRREWRITDWCTGQEKICVQYIVVEDKDAPNVVISGAPNAPGPISSVVTGLKDTVYYLRTVKPHDCNAQFTINKMNTWDCNEVTQSYQFIYKDPAHPGKVIALNETVGPQGKAISLPVGIHIGRMNFRDACWNTCNFPILALVQDITPPNPVCDEFTQVTLDPSTCWARVYAKDLDNGSRDNCCENLHFAIADMDSVEYYRKQYTDHIIKVCGWDDYYKRKTIHDFVVNEFLSVWLFKDYIDLTECGERQVVLRVFDNCKTYRYDPHITKLSEHKWYTLQMYGLIPPFVNIGQFTPEVINQIESVYNLSAKQALDTFKSSIKDREDCEELVTYKVLSVITVAVKQYLPSLLPLNPSNPNLQIIIDFIDDGLESLCIPEFKIKVNFDDLDQFLDDLGDDDFDAATASSGFVPFLASLCNSIYNDCMINILLDDKTLPVCEAPKDIYWYCDNAGGGGRDKKYEYAWKTCLDFSYTNNSGDNFTDFTCVDGTNAPYNQIECVKENNSADDILDPTGREFGYYGCASVSGHEEEHGAPQNPCDLNDYSLIKKKMEGWNVSNDVQIDEDLAQVYKGFSTWVPVYCHSWLCVDKWDAAGKIDAKSAFWSPELHNLGSTGPIAKAAQAGKEKFIVWDNCWIDTNYTVADNQYVDQCGNGWLQRTWTFKDKCTGTITCSQKIYTYHRSDFEVMFPQDLVLNCDANGGTSPDATGRPMIWDDECELVGVTYDDVRFDIIPDACYKIVRTWKLIDWCKYDPNAQYKYPDVIWDDRSVASADRPCVFTKLKDNGDGYMTYTQIIKIVDTAAPTTVKCKDTTVCINTGYGGAGAETDPMCTVPSYNSEPFAATDNCTPANLIEFRWELDVNNDGSVNVKSAAKRTNFKSTEVPGGLIVGVHKLYVISEDNCGQEDTASCLITVKDCKKPTPYCFNGIATVVMPTTQSVVVWAKDLDAGSYDNCTKKADLTFTFGSNGQASDTFSCADIVNGIEQQITVDIWVEDGTKNKDYCRTYILIQDGSGNACTDKAAVAGTIAGKVVTETTDPVENVLFEVKSNNAVLPAYQTDAKGSYAFTNLDMKKDYSIIPKRDDDPSNGISTIDLVLLQKHIQGIEPLNSAYKVIAADVDRSNDVSAVDLVELRKLILTIYDKLPNNTSWRFVPKSYIFNNITTPWGFPEKLDINSLSKDELNRDFVGVKVGDVNATAVAHSLLGAEARSGGQTLKFTTMERELKAGEEAVIEFTSENFKGIEGYQFSLAMKGLDLKSVQSGILKVSESNFGLTKLGQGYVTTSWNESKGITAGANDVLFSIKVKATKATTLSEALVINSKYTRAEAYNNSEALNVALEVGNKKSAAGYALYQNTPNPFKATTVIGYELAKSGAVTMRITDVTGKLVRMYNQDGVKGYNQFKVNRSDISGAGVLYYTIETKDFSATKKMIVVE